MAEWHRVPLIYLGIFYLFIVSDVVFSVRDSTATIHRYFKLAKRPTDWS